MENRTLMNVMEAEEAYKKFLKSSRGIFGFNFKKKENLKSFSEIQKEENAYNSVNLGIKEIPLDKIVGSVEKYADFDKNFVPKNNVVKQRWINIYIGYTSDSMLPTVILYKIKDNYYVYDGNHRVSVAKFLNFATIEAQVEEFLPTKDTKDKVIYRENMIFEKETGLSDIFLSEPIKYKYLKEEIESYKNLLDKRKNENLDLKETAKNWYMNIFLPIKMILSENEIIKNYEGNPDDVFLFFLEHKYYLSKNHGKNVGYLYSVINFINLVKTNENKDLENICEIQTQELIEKCKKLEKIDNELINSNFKDEMQAETELENEIVSYFRNGIEKLSNRYSSYLFESKKMANNEIWTYFAKYILNYIKILNAQENNDFSNMNGENIIEENNFEKEQITKPKMKFDNIEVNTLNYILEVFLPIVEIFLKINEKDCFVVNEYEKLQNDFFCLLKLKNLLKAEGKSTKYENIMTENIEIAINTKNKKVLFGVKEFLVLEKKKEFLKNLKNPEIFQGILKKYGEIKKYETYVKFFIALDNFGEEEFLNNLEKDLKEFYLQDDNVVEYKTEKVMKIENSGIFEDDYEIGFIDFFVINLFGKLF
ncbi:DUF4032 domain-containing protein [Leptotrichia sp. oral taxon 223]|uniref:DUF4032 domain-containing protein n=1 Tax=Leptotrichia sp. oral taxon 223 TaxID=712363 RepID=UPI0015BA5B26|nr:DUF4032 domain-containing protein [Leptotrichia sp. oral taxon 223]NWO18612.1 DUF4032 domain-containing protein [Leptotrichia sp. oral taxon 223]